MCQITIQKIINFQEIMHNHTQVQSILGPPYSNFNMSLGQGEPLKIEYFYQKMW